MESLRLMTNNIWGCVDNEPAWEAQGLDCSAAARVSGFGRVYSELLPDVLGLQECNGIWPDVMMQELTARELPYALLWGKSTSILYRRDKLELVDSRFAIYPEELPGYEGSFNDWKSKSYCIAVLRSKASGKLLIFASTHLWWKSSNPAAHAYQPHSDKARAYQLGLLLDAVDGLREQYGCPAVVVGDLKAGIGSLALQAAIARGYTDGHDLAAEYADETCGHHYCFGDGYKPYDNKRDFTHAIDHILIAGGLEGFVRRFDRYYPDYYMPLSDHFPAWVDVQW